jgi:glutathione S-transferase
MALTLYYHPLASYCHKVLIALYERGLEFERRIIDLGKASERAELCALWPVGKFPVIRDHDRARAVAESSVIIEYLDRQGGSVAPLIPAAPDAALAARLWDRVCDNYVQGPMQEIVLDRIRGADGDLGAARSLLATAYGMLERQLSPGPWLAGAEFSLADCAAAPALFYASTLVPFAKPQRNLHDYFERLIARPSVRRVIEEAEPYFGLYPFAEAIPARFRRATR